jgi:hypothetical protein
MPGVALDIISGSSFSDRSQIRSIHFPSYHGFYIVPLPASCIL